MLAELFQPVITINESGQAPSIESVVKPLESIARFNPQEPVTLDIFTQTFEAVTEELAETYKEGTADFLRQHHPDLAAETQQAYDAINDAWSKNDLDIFRAELERWRQLYFKAIQLYEQTVFPEPPVKDFRRGPVGQAPYLMAPIRETDKTRFFHGERPGIPPGVTFCP